VKNSNYFEFELNMIQYQNTVFCSEIVYQQLEITLDLWTTENWQWCTV